MKYKLDIQSRQEFRAWLQQHHREQSECGVRCSRSKVHPPEVPSYLDCVEEALCFGWIDSTVSHIDGVLYQRFTPRQKGSFWSALNVARCRRLESLGLMTEAGLAVLPPHYSVTIDKDVLEALQRDPEVWRNFCSFPQLYRDIRICNLQRSRSNPVNFAKMLENLIEKTRQNKLYGAWNDDGRLL